MPSSLIRSDSDEDEWASTRQIFARFAKWQEEAVMKKQKRKENRARYTKEERVLFRFQETDHERKMTWQEKMRKKKKKKKRRKKKKKKRSKTKKKKNQKQDKKAT